MQNAILDVANSIKMLRNQAVDHNIRELCQILELSGLDMQLTNEWLIVYQDMATVF